MIRLTPEHTPSFCLSLSALILFWPAIALPMLRIEQFGMVRESSLLAGILELLDSSDWWLGVILMGFSLALPLLKLVLIMGLCVNPWEPRPWRGRLQKLTVGIGKWGMLDVFFVGCVVMFIKLGQGTMGFAPLIGTGVFALMVTCSLLAGQLLPREPA